ncbi:MAG TPA: hypothetical protein IAA35_08280 [Candidatus Alistipes faecigallinarum]|nr:hypothetical protein [Candidatus Alistipes faecigallinarum]
MTNTVFWQTIADYNRMSWPVQVLLVLAGIVLTWRLYRRPAPGVRRVMKYYLALLNGWIAVGYYLVACDARSYNGVMALFWGVMAAVWIYDDVVGYTTFERTRRHDRFALLLCLMPFIYPLFSLLRGLHFPLMTSPVMPCSVALYTIGLLLAFSKRVNLFVILFLCHWALIGLSKVYFFGIPEDLLLAGALVPAIYLFFKEYIDLHFRSDTKPDRRVMRLLLAAMCAGLGLFFVVTIWRQAAALA